MANVTEPEDYVERIGDILGDEFVDGKLQLSLDVSSIDEANLKIEKFDQQQEQLQQMKGEIDQNMKYIDEGYGEASDNVKMRNPGCFASLFGRGNKDIAEQRENLSHGEEIELEPFQQVQQTIDDLLTQLDDVELTLTNYLNENQ